MKKYLLSFLLILPLCAFSQIQSKSSKEITAYVHNYQNKLNDLCVFHVEKVQFSNSYYYKFCIEYNIQPNGSKWLYYNVGQNQKVEVSADFNVANKYHVAIMLDEYIPNSSIRQNGNSLRVILQKPISEQNKEHIIITKNKEAQILLYRINSEDFDSLVNFFKSN